MLKKSMEYLYHLNLILFRSFDIQIMRNSVLILATLAAIGVTQQPAVPTLISFQPTQTCGKHEIVVNGQCVCKKGYVDFRGDCTRCPPDSVYNCQTKQCDCDGYKNWDKYRNICRNQCGVDEEWTKEGCVCRYGKYRKNGRCYDCPYNAHFDNQVNDCTCNNGFVWKKGQCVPDCGLYQIFTPGGGCDCQPGYTRYDGVNCMKCDPWGHWDVNQQKCVCNWGFALKEGKCVPACGLNEIFTPGGGCDCKPGFTKYDGVKCMKCNPWGYWDAYSKQCVCNWGYKLKDYQCVPDCRKNQVFTPGGGCDCKPGFTKYDGINCESCPANSYWDVSSGSCMCNWGLTMKNGQCVKKVQQNKWQNDKQWSGDNQWQNNNQWQNEKQRNW